MLTDKEKGILDKAEDVIKQRIEAMLNDPRPFHAYQRSVCKELQTFFSTLDRIVRIRNMETLTPMPTSCAPEIELKPGMQLVSIEHHG